MDKSIYIIRPNNDVLRTVINHLGNLNPDKEWEVCICEHKKNKTRMQENYFHALVDIICAFNGDTKKDMKRRIAWNCDLREEFVTDEGEVKSIPMSTSGLKVKQYSDIIEATQMICADLGLSYPDPRDFGYE